MSFLPFVFVTNTLRNRSFASFSTLLPLRHMFSTRYAASPSLFTYRHYVILHLQLQGLLLQGAQLLITALLVVHALAVDRLRLLLHLLQVIVKTGVHTCRANLPLDNRIQSIVVLSPCVASKLF